MKMLLVKSLALTTATALALLVADNAHSAPRSEKTKAAVEYLSACGNFVRFDSENVYTGFGPYWTSSVVPRVAESSVRLKRSLAAAP